jgi:hypothetical protein
LSYRDAVKGVVLFRRDAHKLANEDNIVQLHAYLKLKTQDGSGSSQASSVKHIFNFLGWRCLSRTARLFLDKAKEEGNSTPVTPGATVIHNPSSPKQVNKMEQLY